MSLVVTQVGYRNFRNMETRVLEPARGLTVLVGPNAVGKTNCIEGMQVLTCGASFKHASPSELLRQGCDQGSLNMHIEGEKRQIDVACDIHPTRKLYKVNGKRRSVQGQVCDLTSVLFFPDELALVKGPAAGRRDLLDGFGSQLKESYAQVAHDYRRAVYQRNTLFKEAARAGADPDRTLIEAWSASAARAGAVLFCYRQALLARLAPHVERVYGELAAGEGAQVSYDSAWASDFDASTPRQKVEDALFGLLMSNMAEQERRCATLVGPHLDDIDLRICDASARAFASQGQQRSLVLAIKLAQVEFVAEVSGQYPLFLLDDVMSELDASRRSRLFGLVAAGVQTVVTTTNLDYFSAAELDRAKVVMLP